MHTPIPSKILKIDDALYKLLKDFEILSFVNPINIEEEKELFFHQKFNQNPNFRYSKLTVDTHQLKAQMFRLPIEDIKHPLLHTIYRDIIGAYADKTDMISAIGKGDFLFNSLRYFGQPSKKDIANANFLLYCNELPDYLEEPFLDFEEIIEGFQTAVKNMGFDFKIRISSNIPSDVLVLNSQKTLQLKMGAQFTRSRLNALIHHEVGVHVLTSQNAIAQPLRIMQLGLPNNTVTQEGLAIYSEYKCGGLTVTRLKELALRVLAVESLTNGNDFKTTFQMLLENHNPNPNKLFYLVTRVYRGGGFTKDFLYLRGFRKILELTDQQTNIQPLFIGKTHHQYLAAIDSLVNEGFLHQPQLENSLIKSPSKSGEILKYITNSIKN